MSAERRACTRLPRRNFLVTYTALTAGVLLGVASRVRSEPASAGPADPALIEDLVAANRILADQGVVDGYGHVSARHNLDPNRYLLARSIAPELVTAEDIVEFDLDSNPVDPRGRKFYLERFIHGEIYRRRPDVLAVVHSHSPAAVPFSVTGMKLRPMFHMWLRQKAMMSDSVALAPSFNSTKAQGTSPHLASGFATTAANRTAGCL